MTKKVQCDRCGKCCLQGGPALHTQDRHLVEEKIFTFADLVTVRKGELAYQPMAQEPEVVKEEFLKLQGIPGSWICKYYDGIGKKCTIYGDRPVACRVLECTSPEALLTITGKNLLTRFDCIDSNDPLLEIVKEHEQECGCPDFNELMMIKKENGSPSEEQIASLQALVNKDLAYRTMADSKYGLSLARELFYFGRPIFQQLAPLGIVSVQQGNGLELIYRP